MVDGVTSFTESSANNWTYDSRGNWLSFNDETRTPTITNEIASISDGINEFSLLYDDIGNLISDGTKVLTWTVDGLLESVTAGDVNINFTYDALNRRVEKKVYINDMLNKTTEYIYDNWQVIEERSGANVKSFVYGDYIDEVVYNETDGVGYYPLRGVNYNIEALTNSSGDLVETYAIDAFGNFKVFDADGVEKFMSDRLISILFQGREYDDDVGLYYFRNRWYSVELGRFISRDPLRYDAEDINLFRFIGNRGGYNGLDPMGLEDVYFLFGSLIDLDASGYNSETGEFKNEIVYYFTHEQIEYRASSYVHRLDKLGLTSKIIYVDNEGIPYMMANPSKITFYYGHTRGFNSDGKPDAISNVSHGPVTSDDLKKAGKLSDRIEIYGCNSSALKDDFKDNFDEVEGPYKDKVKQMKAWTDYWLRVGAWIKEQEKRSNPQ